MIKGSPSSRVAFLLNVNAKSVTSSLRKKISQLVPQKDLYFSKNLNEAKTHCENIIDQGYAYLFCGGGDGTVVNTINILLEHERNNPLIKLPKVGILSLGTGNALARALNTGDPLVDVQKILAGHKMDHHLVSLIETEDGKVTPFAGIGYDGEIIKDFSSVKGIFFKSPFRKIFSSVLGFALVGLFKTLPRQLVKKAISAKLKSFHNAYQIVRQNNKDEEILIKQDELLFHGKAALICVGTIQSVGYDFTMFPFAKRRPGFMHLRVSAVPLGVLLSHLPAIWQGVFRHPKLYDFLVKDVEIKANKSLAYQFAGEAMGQKNRLYFKIASEQIAMVSLSKQKNIKFPSTPLLTRLGFLCVFLLMLSCQGHFNGTIKKRYTTFGLTSPSGWQVERFKGADIYLTHSQSNSSIVINANCEKISQSPLMALTAQMLAGFTDITYLSQETIEIAEREGLLSSIIAKLDGVKRYIRILVLRKNRCVYDMVLLSPKQDPVLIKDFDEMINTFFAKADL